MNKYLLSAAIAVMTVPAAAYAGPVAGGFTTTGTVTTCDDCNTGLIASAFALNYFGTTYNGFYVSSNGYITFGSGQSAYTPVGLGSGYTGLPIIAAFYADVDTRGTGVTSYGTGTYAGHAANAITWNAVGYYSGHSDKTNTFQIILTDRTDTGTGNFDIYLNYDQIQWETGDVNGGSGGLGGNAASAGYNAGTGGGAGTYYELPGSRAAGSFLDTGTNPLIRQTNDGVPGQYLFQVRNGNVTPPPPPPGVPEPASWAMMIAGFGLVGGALRRRRTGVAFQAA